MSSSRGFTIIEIMIVVVMIAILASIAIPSYTQYVLRAKIQEATSTLLSQRVKLEQFFQDQRTYVGACAPGTVAPMPGGLKYFAIACNPLTAAAYTITATGNCGAGVDASMCGFSYSIDQGNNRVTVAVPAGWNLPAGNCWVTKQGGQC
jgi:type IV pilus assembly protein PilE